MSKFQVQISVLEKQKTSYEMKHKELNSKVEELASVNDELKITNPYLHKHLQAQISQDFEELLHEKDKEIKEWVDAKMLSSLNMQRNDQWRGLKEDFVNITKEYLALKLHNQNINSKYNAISEELDKLNLAFKGLKTLSEQNTQRSVYDSPYNSQNVSNHNDSYLKELNEYRDKVFDLEQMLAEYIKEKEMNKKS